MGEVIYLNKHIYDKNIEETKDIKWILSRIEYEKDYRDFLKEYKGNLEGFYKDS